MTLRGPRIQRGRMSHDIRKGKTYADGVRRSRENLQNRPHRGYVHKRPAVRIRPTPITLHFLPALVTYNRLRSEPLKRQFLDLISRPNDASEQAEVYALVAQSRELWDAHDAERFEDEMKVCVERTIWKLQKRHGQKEMDLVDQLSKWSFKDGTKEEEMEVEDEADMEVEDEADMDLSKLSKLSLQDDTEMEVDRESAADADMQM